MSAIGVAQIDRQVADVVERERGRLWRFIRGKVSEVQDAEDLLQEAFSELLEAYRLMKPIEQVTAWMYRGMELAFFHVRLFTKETGPD